MPVEEIRQLKRVASGVAGLDDVLHGGLFQGGLYVIMGVPGAGKTILSTQIAFHQIAAGGRAIYVTLLSETHTRMLAYLQTLRFFDPSVIPEQLSFFSGYGPLRDAGLEGLLDFLLDVLLAHAPTLLILDGLMNVEATSASDMAFRHFLQALYIAAESHHCTTLLLTHANEAVKHPPAHTIADGVLELNVACLGLRSVRELEVWKLRGSDFLPGRHAFAITEAGLVVYPRAEVALTAPPAIVDAAAEVCRLGIPQLDSMLRGGVAAHTTTLVLGPTGSGKTILGLQFLATGVQAGETGCYFGFYEQPAPLIAKGDATGLALSQAVAQEQLVIVWQPLSETNLDMLAARLLATVAQRQVRRLFIDDLTAFSTMTTHPERISLFFAVLGNELRARGVTTLVAVELHKGFDRAITMPTETVSALMDNILVLRVVEMRSQLHRLIAVLKVRERDYDHGLREFRITAHGIDVARTAESATALLRGTITRYWKGRRPPGHERGGAVTGDQ